MVKEVDKDKMPVGCKWFLGGLAVVVLIGGFVAYKAGSVALKAEATLQADICVLTLLNEHLKKNTGNWPSSWEELQSTSPGTTWYIWKWPDDVDEIKARIHVDFTLQTEDVAKMDVDSFTAVRQTYPNYGRNDPWIEQLLKTARDVVEQRQQKADKFEKK